MVILFDMLIVSFALWGVGDMLRMGGRSTEVAHVGGTHIPLYGWVGGASVSVDEVSDQFNRQLEGIQRQTGQRPEPEQALRLACMFARWKKSSSARCSTTPSSSSAWWSATPRCAPRSRAIPPSPAPAARSIPCSSATACSRRASARQQYITDIRREIAASQLFGAVRTDGLAPKSLRDDIFKMEAERRVAETIYIPDSIIVDVPKPTAEQLSAYFEANKTKFQIPEFRAFSYVLLTADDVMSQVGVTADR